MAKAVLELPEMPESCKTCPIKRYLHYGWVEHICGITGEQIADKGRRSDCPLKLVEGCEYCTGENPPTLFENGETIIYYHPGHGRFLDGTYELNWKACPMCGRRLEVEEG